MNAGPEPTYEEKIRVPPPGGSVYSSIHNITTFRCEQSATTIFCVCNTGLDKQIVLSLKLRIFSYLSILTYAVGPQKTFSLRPFF